MQKTKMEISHLLRFTVMILITSGYIPSKVHSSPSLILTSSGNLNETLVKANARDAPSPVTISSRVSLGSEPDTNNPQNVLTGPSSETLVGQMMQAPGEITKITSEETNDSISARRDQIAQASTGSASVSHYQSQHPANHKSYQPESQQQQQQSQHQATSASYISPLNLGPGSLSIQQQQHINSLLNRDHHHELASGSNEVANFANSFGNQAPMAFNRGDRSSHLLSSLVPDHNSGQNYTTNSQTNTTNGYVPINAGLISQLTASLFPVKQLSNATLLSLSLLLNKTRNTSQPENGFNKLQLNSNNQNQPPLTDDNFRQYSMQHQNQPSKQFGFQSSFGFDYPTVSHMQDEANKFNLFDYISRPPQNHHQQQQLPHMNMFKPTLQVGSQKSFASSVNSANVNPFQFKSGGSNQLYLNHNYLDNLISPSNSDIPNHKTSSNLYNTYLPYKEYLSPLSSFNYVQRQNSGGTAFDGGSNLQNGGLAQANKLFFETSKAPSRSLFNQASYSPLSNLVLQGMIQGGRSSSTSPMGGESQASNSPAALNYQYIQHQNINNQNHLDKVVYHSTPFRPVIVSPPQSLVNNSGSGGGASSGGTGVGYQSGQLVTSGQRPDDQPPGKTNSQAQHAGAFSTSSSSMSDTTTDYANSSGSQYTSKLETKDAVDGSKQLSDQQDGSGDMFDALPGPTKSPGASQSSSSSPSHSSSTSSIEAGSSNERPATGGNNINNISSSSASGDTNALGGGSMPAASMLLDLYEREVDNQIREALFGPAEETAFSADSLISLSQSTTPSYGIGELAVASQTPASSSEAPAPSSWLRPSALGSTQQAFRVRPMTGSSGSAVSQQQQQQQQQLVGAAAEQLMSALQELPTFSASDLQPIAPSVASYSALLAGATPAGGVAQEPAGTQLGSLLATHLWAQPRRPAALQSAASGAKPAASSPSQSSTAQQTASTSGALPAFLFKLQSSPLSSILATPLTHLYSSVLPKHTRLQAQAASGSAAALNRRPNGTKQQTGQQAGLSGLLFSGSGLRQPQAAASETSEATVRILDRQQRARQQAAMAQLLLGSFAEPGGHLQPGELFSSTNSEQSLALQTGSRDHLDGLLGANEPLVWRSILPHLYSTSGRHKPQQSQQYQSLLGAPQTLASQSMMLQSMASQGGLQLPLKASQSSGSLSGASEQSQHSIQAAEQKLKVKLVKVPVAFYEQLSPTTGSTVSLVPAALQPNVLAATILAAASALSCPLHQSSAGSGQLSQSSQLQGIGQSATNHNFQQLHQSLLNSASHKALPHLLGSIGEQHSSLPAKSGERLAGQTRTFASSPSSPFDLTSKVNRTPANSAPVSAVSTQSIQQTPTASISLAPSFQLPAFLSAIRKR